MGFGQKSLFRGCEPLENHHICLLWAISSSLHPQNIDICLKPFIECIPYHAIYHKSITILISDEVNQVFLCWRLFLWSFSVFSMEIVGEKSTNFQLSKILEKIQGLFFYKRDPGSRAATWFADIGAFWDTLTISDGSF